MSDVLLTILLITVTTVVVVIVLAKETDTNQTECENLCLVRGSTFAEAKGWVASGDCFCWKLEATISEGER